MYAAHAKRMAVERLNVLKSAMISGVWGNSNYDDDKQSRDKILHNIDEFYDRALNEIYTGVEEEVEIDQDNPFFAAMKRPEVLQMRIDNQSAEELHERTA